MPKFDGTGPQGTGPLTGRGEGYCAVAYPEDSTPYGYAGLQGTPVRGLRLMRWLGRFASLPYIGGRNRGGRGRGRGRWLR